MLKRLLLSVIVLAGIGVALATAQPVRAPSTTPEIRVAAEGLIAPIGLAVLPGGGLLVAEQGTGAGDDSGGVSLVTPDGRVGRLVSGLASSRDSGDLAGVPLVGLSPRGDRLYIGNFGQGHLWTLPLTPEQQANGLDLPEAPLTTADLEPAMQPLNNVRLVNPFDIAFDMDGRPVVTDASGNGLAKETPGGTTRFFHRFADLPNPANPADPVEAVPTGLARIGDEYFVTLTGGCPYPEGAGRVVAVDEQRQERTVVSDLNMPIDIAQGPDGTLWLLEFARFTPGASCFSGEGYQPASGQLSRLHPDGRVEPVLTGLDFPGAVLPLPDGDLYISEVFSGRVLRITP